MTIVNTHGEPDFCQRCGEQLKSPVFLELRMGTDEWYKPGVLPPNDSQGCFAFGATCARKQLIETATKSP